MGVLSDISSIKTADEASLEKYAALESEIVLAALRESCDSDAEWASLIESAATEMALYDVIDDASIATETAKRIVVSDWKAANFSRIEKRTAIRLAMVNQDQIYFKYKKYRDLFLEAREKIYKKYGARARIEAKRIIKNSKRKAANMSSPAGKTIVDKLDRQIDKATASVESK